MVFEATYLVAVLTAGQTSLCCGQNRAKLSKVFRPSNKSNGIPSLSYAEETASEWDYPPAILEAATGIFLWPAWRLYDSIKGDKFKHINFLMIFSRKIPAR
jgi:hypothetical protein